MSSIIDLTNLNFIFREAESKNFSPKKCKQDKFMLLGEEFSRDKIDLGRLKEKIYATRTEIQKNLHWIKYQVAKRLSKYLPAWTVPLTIVNFTIDEDASPMFCKGDIIPS